MAKNIKKVKEKRWSNGFGWCVGFNGYINVDFIRLRKTKIAEKMKGVGELKELKYECKVNE